ncbi:MAG: DUF6502 family protein, partial [Casimicrobium sp.]
DKDRSNASKLSMMTGLHRKDVGARLTQPELAKPIDQKLDKHSAARRVFAKWLHLLRRNPQRKELPISSNSKRVSNFYDLVRENISDVHPRAVLDELVRLGLVIESGELVSISKTNFIEKSSTNEKMPVFTHNLNAHLMTSVGNILASRPAQLERAIWIENISKIDAERIEELARLKWEIVRNDVYDAMRSAPRVEGVNSPKYKISVGTYACYEPT